MDSPYNKHYHRNAFEKEASYHTPPPEQVIVPPGFPAAHYRDSGSDDAESG